MCEDIDFYDDGDPLGCDLQARQEEREEFLCDILGFNCYLSLTMELVDLFTECAERGPQIMEKKMGKALSETKALMSEKDSGVDIREWTDNEIEKLLMEAANAFSKKYRDD